MTVKIRLARHGSKKRPYYKVVVANSRSPRDGKFIVSLGFFNPLKDKDTADRFTINTSLANEWIDKGAVLSDTVAKLMLAYGIKLPENITKAIKRQKNNPKKPSKKELKQA